MRSSARAGKIGLTMCRTISLTIGGVFVVSAFAHLCNPYYFLSAVLAYQILSSSSAVVIAVLLPFLQMTVGVAILSGYFRGPALFTAAFLLVVFIVIQLSAFLRRLDIECGCFGSGYPAAVGFRSVGVTILLLAATAGVLIVRKSQYVMT